MVWLLERGSVQVVCEIKREPENTYYEFAVATSDGARETREYGSPTELIESYLAAQREMLAQGYRPRICT